MKQFFASLSPKNRYIAGNLFFLYLVQGICTLLIGSVLPMMKAEYGLNYGIGGMLISAHSIGNIIISPFAGLFPLYFGQKNSLMVLNLFLGVGLAVTLLTGNPYILLIALLMTGLGRGAVSTYNNSIINQLSGGQAAPLNALHGFFAIGAVSAPVIALAATSKDDHGWKIAVAIAVFFCALTVLSSARMQMDNTRVGRGEKQPISFGFFRHKLFWISSAIMLFYLAVESSVMGWMVTFYTDSGVVGSDSAQLLNSLLWVTILIGRFACVSLSSKMHTSRLILMLSGGMFVFFTGLMFSHSLIPMIIMTIGLGLCMSGMYGTTVGNCGSILKDYPLGMSIFVTITGIGSIVTPSIVGSIADASNIRTGMAVLIAALVCLLISALLNIRYFRKAK